MSQDVVTRDMVARSCRALPDGFAADLRRLYTPRAAQPWALCAVLGHARANGWTLQAMGDALGVSRERIRQLAPRPVLADPSVLPIAVPVWERPEPPARPEPTRPKVAICGTTGGYKRHRNLGEPTCPSCRSVWTETHKQWRHSRVAAEAPVHGSASTYRNWSCRCEPCSAAHAKDLRERKQAKAGPIALKVSV